MKKTVLGGCEGQRVMHVIYPWELSCLQNSSENIIYICLANISFKIHVTKSRTIIFILHVDLPRARRFISLCP